MNLNPAAILQTITDRIQGTAPKGARRSSKWRKTRDGYLAEKPDCEICARGWSVEVHHVIPFHIAPDLELEDGNLVTLCRRCHLLIGHLGSWSRVNWSCHTDVVTLSFRIDIARGAEQQRRAAV